MDNETFISQQFGSDEQYQQTLADHPDIRQFIIRAGNNVEAGYRAWQTDPTRLARQQAEHNASVLAGGGLLPGMPGFLIPWPTPGSTGGNGMRTNGYSLVGRTGGDEMLVPPPSQMGDTVAIRTVMVTGAPADIDGQGGTVEASVLGLLGSLGLLTKLAPWLPKIVALVLGGMGIYAAVQSINRQVDSQSITGGGGGSSILGGPGVPEPKEGTYYKTWHTKYERRDGRDGLVYFWALNDGRVVSWDNQTGRSKVWRPKKPVAVIMSGGKTSLATAVRAQRHLDKLWRTVAKRTKALKLA